MTRAGIAIRLAVLGAAILCLVPVQVVGIRFGRPVAGRLPVLVHRLFLRLFGVRVRVVGAPPDPGTPTLILANHVSWLDIPVLSSLRPMSFIAKSEIAGWPLVGILSRLQRCVFLDRSRRSATAEVNGVVAARLAGGDAIVLFAEGTTGDGIRLLPFRSSLVGAAKAAVAAPEEEPVRIRLQPLAVVYLGRAGLPVTRREMPDLAWYGDMELPPHLSAFVRHGPVDVVAVWGEPIAFGATSDRKAATAQAETSIRDAIAAIRRIGGGALFSCASDRRKGLAVSAPRPSRHRLA